MDEAPPAPTPNDLPAPQAVPVPAPAGLERGIPPPPVAPTATGKAGRGTKAALIVTISLAVVLAAATTYLAIVYYAQVEQIDELTADAERLGQTVADERAQVAARDEAIATLDAEIDDLQNALNEAHEDYDGAEGVARAFDKCLDLQEDLIDLEVLDSSPYYTLDGSLLERRNAILTVCASANKAYAHLIAN